MTSRSGRTADHPVHPLFLDRWSPRRFSAEPIAEAQLAVLFEAARWAPSSGNLQPWRFLYSRRADEHWSAFLRCLNEKNQGWAAGAAALVAVASRPVAPARDGKQAKENRSHSFDSGAAWACLALQASLEGWVAHAIGGFDEERARHGLRLPPELALHCFVAIGRHAEGDEAKPNDRAPQASFVRAGPFPG